MRHKFSNRRNSLVILFLLAASMLTSQVKIRERVTIAPVADTAQGAYHQLTEKWKALTKNAVKVNAVSPGKNKANALITLPQSGQITISVLDGASAASLDLVLRSPVQEVLLQDANNHHGFTWDTTGLPVGTTFDIGLEWHYGGESGSEYGCDVERINDSTCILGFEDLGIQPMNVDLIVLVQLGQPPQLDHFAVTVTPDTIHHFGVSAIHVQAKDALNNDMLTFYNTQLKITGNDAGTYGHVEGNWIPAETFSYRDAQNGSVRYYANGSEPDYVQNIVLRVEKADDPGKNGNASITLLPGVVNHFVVLVIPDSIVYDDFAYVFAVLVDDNGNEVPLGDNTPITVTATPDNVGWFYQSVPMTYADLRSGYFVYQAGPEQLFEFRDVTIKVEGPGKAGEGKLVVKPKPCLVMQLSKNSVAPGDTVELTFQQRQLDGTLAPYPEDQMFKVWMNTDESYGTLESGWGWQGSPLIGPPPFLFIAANSITGDSAIVQLQATETSGGVPSSVRQGPKPEFQKQAKASVSKLMKILNPDAMPPGGKDMGTGTFAPKGKAKGAAQPKNSLALWKKTHAVGNVPQDVGGCVPTGTIVVTTKVECIKVAFFISHISPGDTVLLKFTTTDANGMEVSIPASTPLDVFLMGDSTNGFLLSQAGTMGRQLTGATQPIWYVAPDSIQGDSVQVNIRAARSEQPASSGSVSAKSITNVKYVAVTKNGKGQPAFAPLKLTPALVRALADDACSVVAGLVAKPSSQFTKFDVRLSRDTLEYPQTADLTVIAVDKDGQEVAIDTSTALFLAFDDGGPYVDFIRAPGDTVETALNNVSYGTLRAAKVKIVAAKKTIGPPPVNAAISPAKHLLGRSSAARTMQEGGKQEFPKSQIIVAQVSDATKVGMKYVVLKPSIKVIAVQDSIKPFYPDPGHPNQYLIDTMESRTKLKVAVTVSGRLYSPAVPTHVKLTSAPVDNSGGHSHTANRPTGYFGDSIRDTVKTKDFETGTDTLRTSYLASKFGGKERMIATLSDFSAIADTDTVVVRVPGLVLFQGTGRYVMGRIAPAHPDNHYVAGQHTIDDLIGAANEFNGVNWNNTGRMRLNDMSLRWGGLFDIHSDWISPHDLHRVGKSVDIENIVVKDTTMFFEVDGQQEIRTVSVGESDWLTRFVNLMSRHSWGFVDEHQTTPNLEGDVRWPHFEWRGN